MQVENIEVEQWWLYNMVHNINKSQRNSFRFHIVILLMSNFKSSWPFYRGIKQNKITLGTAKSWLWPLNRSGHWTEVFLASWHLLLYFSRWPSNIGRQNNRGPLNRGSTVPKTVYCPELLKSWKSHDLVSGLYLFCNIQFACVILRYPNIQSWPGS